MQPEMLRHADFSHFITSLSHAFFIRSQRVVWKSFLDIKAGEVSVWHHFCLLFLRKLC